MDKMSLFLCTFLWSFFSSEESEGPHQDGLALGRFDKSGSGNRNNHGAARCCRIIDLPTHMENK